ncbi:GAF domain-containing sensor histidine kinase [Aliifodinibius sp. S!AR15-10]|uniref:GAF domain-containing sensor histidine kinase n=1 Tax=Aliifodinibius sp. S!AR15-10 TaxID=2950437 RepID=UPI00285DF8ED|nr:GAF domain-containing sensor histidine kinase [Aliifodinibius sp. S!AR15-10]MDR8389626.1 GAF domain-containing sensor histidine kinase [Aliifodinibius sp. S!AR15-10]
MDDQQHSNGTEKAPIPGDELERVLNLSELDLDYGNLQDSLEDLNKLAAHVAGTQISLVNLIDSYTQWSVSNYGIETGQLPREESVCQYTILQNEQFEVPSLKADDRFKTKEYVVHSPNLEYYFGIPLTTQEGHNIGALCVLDTETKELTPEKIELLKIIAKEIVTRLESIHKINDLRQTLKNISDLPRKVLHDIRGPVGGIVGLAEIIKSEAQEKNFDDILDLIDLINKGGRSVLELADELLSANSQNGSNKTTKPKKYEFSTIQLREKLQELFAPQATAKDVELKITSTGDHQKLPFPKQKLLQIIGNLISNAIKFTQKDGRVSVTLHLQVADEKLSDHSHQLQIVVRDDGVGMSPEQIKKIQDDTQNLKNESTEGTFGEKGYGFGIQLVKHLVKTLDGKLEVRSQKGEGSTIKVSIPMLLKNG